MRDSRKKRGTAKRSAEVITTALGAVEVEAHGSGTPIIAVHGSPGGIDAARMMVRFLPPGRFRTIALSRPGYLGTPLDAADTSIDHEADLLAAVIDALGVDRAGVRAWSGGGPSAYRLAVRHPERVSSLIQVAALSSRWVRTMRCPTARSSSWSAVRTSRSTRTRKRQTSRNKRGIGSRTTPEGLRLLAR